MWTESIIKIRFLKLTEIIFLLEDMFWKDINYLVLSLAVMWQTKQKCKMGHIKSSAWCLVANGITFKNTWFIKHIKLIIIK